MSNESFNYRDFFGIGPGNSGRVNQSRAKDGWVTVSVNWPRIQSAFAYAGFAVSQTAKDVVDAPGVAMRGVARAIRGAHEKTAPKLAFLAEWKDSVYEWLKRMFQRVTHFFSGVAHGPAQQAKAAGADAPVKTGDAKDEAKFDEQALKAVVPEKVAPTMVDSLDAFLDSVVPPDGLKATDLPKGLGEGTVAALAAAQANMTLHRYGELGAMSERVIDELVNGLKASPLAADLKVYPPEQVGAALLNLTRTHPDHPLVKMADPDGKLTALTTRFERLQDLQKTFLEASAFNLHMASRAGVPEDVVSDVLAKNNMPDQVLRDHLIRHGLGDAHEAYMRRADPTYVMKAPEPSPAAAAPPAATSSPTSSTVSELRAFGVGNLRVIDGKEAAAQQASHAVLGTSSTGFGALRQFAATEDELAGHQPDDSDEAHEDFESAAPRG
ncbi:MULTISPECIES: hypothetical protein [unclassified Burkholderia]|uniref:hypothetical protein n=1 Tax=unclassified Burkholderia TaxID=2613784 RepID=UPI002AAF65E0|nr:MULTISPECIES: hypothetical protein [unclassified Burkholderia]